MFLLNAHPDHRKPLLPEDAETLGPAGAAAVEAQIRNRENYTVTPLHDLPGLAAQLGVGAIQIKDEGHRLGLGSFKALGGSYVVVKLLLEEAARRLGRPVEIAEL
ncbi:MAG: diaminopropionate ammonia-lyase, partial [Bosea sp. (in: a-proteobacteria)]|nr:diaminopropionate ammonia-lyase [Bosea sp. (in: a-proteobacteria)]